MPKKISLAKAPKALTIIYMQKKIYLAKAPDDYIKNVSQLPIGSTAVYYIIKPKHHLDGDELHIVSDQPNGNFFKPDLEGSIIETRQYQTTVSGLFAKYSNNLNAIGMKAGSQIHNFVNFIQQNISSSANGNTDIWAVEFVIRESSKKHHYQFNKGNGQLQPVPIIAYIQVPIIAHI